MVYSNYILLSGTVGSTAYGLAREGSDVDTLGVFATPTSVIASMDWTPKNETVVTTRPDSTYHEVRKFLRLVMKGNPTVTELFWLPQYITLSDLGQRMLELRDGISTTPRIADAYIGYATAQIKRLEERGDGTFSSDTRNRTAKHARHMLRLLRQAQGFMVTGRLDIVVDNPEDYWAFDNMTPEQMRETYETELVKARMAESNSVLPFQVNEEAVRAFLIQVRNEIT